MPAARLCIDVTYVGGTMKFTSTVHTFPPGGVTPQHVPALDHTCELPLTDRVTIGELKKAVTVEQVKRLGRAAAGADNYRTKR